MADTPTSMTSIGSVYQPSVVGQEFLRWVNDPTEFYVWLEHTFRGEVLTIGDNNKEKWELPRGMKQQMTKEGAVACVSKLRPMLNPFTFHGTYKEEEIPDLVMPIVTEIDIWLKRNQKAFRIADENISMIAISMKILVNTAFHMANMIKFYEEVMKVNFGTPAREEKGKIFGIFPK